MQTESASCLAWTCPEDCSRDAITVKLNDRWLGEDGTEVEEENDDIDTAEDVSTK